MTTHFFNVTFLMVIKPPTYTLRTLVNLNYSAIRYDARWNSLVGVNGNKIHLLDWREQNQKWDRNIIQKWGENTIRSGRIETLRTGLGLNGSIQCRKRGPIRFYTSHTLQLMRWNTMNGWNVSFESGTEFISFDHFVSFAFIIGIFTVYEIIQIR